MDIQVYEFTKQNVVKLFVSTFIRHLKVLFSRRVPYQKERLLLYLTPPNF